MMPQKRATLNKLLYNSGLSAYSEVLDMIWNNNVQRVQKKTIRKNDGSQK